MQLRIRATIATEAAMNAVHRLECVLVADDLTDRSFVAIERALALPLAPGAELHVAHVVDAPVVPAKEVIVADARRAMGERVGRARGLVGSGAQQDVRVNGHVVEGQAFVEIIRQARALGAQLIVVGRHRRRPARDLFIGSTAERIVRKGDVPVLLVAHAVDGPYRRVLAAVDLGETSRRVVELAASLTEPEGRTLTLVHAYQLAFEPRLQRTAPTALQEMKREQQVERSAAGARLRESLQPLGVDCALVLRSGEPRATVVREAVRRHADLIVLGTHGRSGVAHALLGSIAEWLIRAAPCDVAVTRPARFTFELP